MVRGGWMDDDESYNEDGSDDGDGDSDDDDESVFD